MSGGPTHCDCSHIPIPEKGEEHLIDCPVRIWAALTDGERFAADMAEANRLFDAGDLGGLEEFMGRHRRERAHAVFLRGRYSAPSVGQGDTDG